MPWCKVGFHQRPLAIKKDSLEKWIVPEKSHVLEAKQGQIDDSLDVHAAISLNQDRDLRLNCVGLSRREDLEFLETLGCGAFGVVSLVKTKDEKRYALKELFQSAANVEARETEISVLALGITHPFINKIHSVILEENRTFLVLEYLCGGDLWYHLSQGAFTEDQTRFYTAEMVLGLQILHGHGIIHRDLNLCNVLLDLDGHVKLADFGLAKEGVGHGQRPAHSICGTPGYMAPEVANGNLYGGSVDWWSLGICLAEMLVFSPVPPEFVSSWAQDYIPADVDPAAKLLVDGFLQTNPDDRLGCNSDRGGEEEIRKHKFFEKIDWEKLERRQLPAPFVPEKVSRKSARYFDPNIKEKL